MSRKAQIGSAGTHYLCISSARSSGGTVGLTQVCSGSLVGVAALLWLRQRWHSAISLQQEPRLFCCVWGRVGGRVTPPTLILHFLSHLSPPPLTSLVCSVSTAVSVSSFTPPCWLGVWLPLLEQSHQSCLSVQGCRIIPSVTSRSPTLVFSFGSAASTLHICRQNSSRLQNDVMGL